MHSVVYVFYIITTFLYFHTDEFAHRAHVSNVTQFYNILFLNATNDVM